jgi:quercetin dioxygenase-like cupin family protein
MNQIQPKFEFSYNGVQTHIFHADKADGLIKHTHVYSHATYCCSGSIVVRKENKEVVLSKNSKPVNLIAGQWHEIEALEDGTVFVNVFAEGKY